MRGSRKPSPNEFASQNIVVKLVVPRGGVTGTSFAERSFRDYAKKAASADYDDFVARMTAAFASMVAALAISADEVAQDIYGAASDGTDRLRYHHRRGCQRLHQGAARAARPGLCRCHALTLRNEEMSRVARRREAD
jgi:hypothetical protein